VAKDLDREVRDLIVHRHNEVPHVLLMAMGVLGHRWGHLVVHHNLTASKIIQSNDEVLLRGPVMDLRLVGIKMKALDRRDGA